MRPVILAVLLLVTSASGQQRVSVTDVTLPSGKRVRIVEETEPALVFVTPRATTAARTAPSVRYYVPATGFYAAPAPVLVVPQRRPFTPVRNFLRALGGL